VKANQAVHCVRTMCRLLGVSTSGFYASVGRPMSTRAKEDLVLTAQLEAAHAESRKTYGAPRLHAELAANGVQVGRKRVARLMLDAGLVGISPRKSTFTTVRDPKAQPSDDLVKRNFEATRADQLWVADITYVPTWNGFLYLAVVLDAWSRKIVGCSPRSKKRRFGRSFINRKDDDECR
jgi:putative transposase